MEAGNQIERGREMSEKLNRFTSLMKSIFELDKSDLDFGIYRIMNIRKAEIEKFLSEGLPNKVQETLAPFASNTEDIEKRIAEIEKICSDVGVEVASSKMADEYTGLKSQLTGGVDMSALETDVYSALYSFFNRYYDEGDFISKRRYKDGVYAIPYEGEEVKLYWANQDQYYIKTAENFKDYTFKDGDRTVHFRLVDATTEHNNNKENDDNKRTFMLWEETEEYPDIKTIEVNDNEMIIRFVFDVPEDKKKKYAEENYQRISAAIVSNYKQWFDLLRPVVNGNPKKTKTLLEKHLEAYVAKNTFDYFIHKNLKEFLTRELDLYIKNEIIHLDDIDTINEKRVGTYLAKVKAIKRVGKIIIDFLTQIEDFQRKLWLKKKFVVSTDWCITLDKIDEMFFSEIIANKSQLKEWIDLYAIDGITNGSDTVAFSEPITKEFLRQNMNLIVDTKHFSTEFKERLVASINDIDVKTNGLMIHSENFQALSLLEAKYNNKIDCCYIDPPYNTDASAILYKNNYKHASFLSLMENRLHQGKALLRDEAIISVAIDDAEMPYLKVLLGDIFSKEIGTVVVRSNPQGRKTKGKFSPQHEYGMFFGNSEKSVPVSIGYSEEKEKRYPLVDDKGRYSWMNFIRAGNNDLRSDRPKLYYPIIVTPKDTIRIPKLKWNSVTEEYDVLENLKEGEVFVFPNKLQNGQLIEKNWQRGHERVKSELEEYRVRRLADGISIDFKTRMDDEAMPTTWWDKNEYASANYGPMELKNLFGAKEFDFCKALGIVRDALKACGLPKQGGIVIDYFAGSGTTGHAVLDINRTEEDSNRKYILVEMGDYFNTVTKPRMKKVVYSNEWKDGKPISRNTGLSQIIKYIRLESYEDALSNISLSDEKHKLSSLFGDSYLINYMLDVEAQGSLIDLDRFKTPFDYRLNINENNETKERTIDLVETFNYLLGVSVVRQSVISFFKAKLDEEGSYEGAIRLEKDIDGQYAFKEIEGVLPDGRRALVIWRTITDDLIASNAALDAYFAKHRITSFDNQFDVIYVNGDNNLKVDEECKKVNLIEIEFKKRMFEEA
jgi:adenine-specific DNA-methyltransferase